MARVCPDQGITDEARTAMADGNARARLLQHWADEAAGWAREQAVRSLEDVAANRQELPEQEVKQRRGQLWRALQKISPGKSNTLSLVSAADGSLGRASSPPSPPTDWLSHNPITVLWNNQETLTKQGINIDSLEADC